MPTHARRHQLRGSLIYHAYNRCAVQGRIFHTEQDFIHFMMLLTRYAEKFAVDIYHWVIMHTHFHLLLELEEPSVISGFMGAIAHAYTHYHHKNFGTRGFLWQGRFKLQPVQRERYLRACGRYIENNPVRAKIVEDPCDYPWSSARFYCMGECDGITRRSPEYPILGTDEQGRRSAYRHFLDDSDSDEENRFNAMEEPVGEVAFRNLLRRHGGRLMPQRQGRKIIEPYCTAYK